MKLVSVIILLACTALLFTLSFYGHQQLPEEIASHFNASGVANGWMTKSSFRTTMWTVGLGIPAFVIGIMYSIRFFPAKYLNVPNPSYWREPANYRKACDFLFVSSIWFGSAFLVWQTFFTQLVISANLASPPRLNNTHAILLTAALLVSTFTWVLLIVLRFRRSGHAEIADRQ